MKRNDGINLPDAIQEAAYKVACLSETVEAIRDASLTNYEVKPGAFIVIIDALEGIVAQLDALSLEARDMVEGANDEL